MTPRRGRKAEPGLDARTCQLASRMSLVVGVAREYSLLTSVHVSAAATLTQLTSVPEPGATFSTSHPPLQGGAQNPRKVNAALLPFSFRCGDPEVRPHPRGAAGMQWGPGRGQPIAASPGVLVSTAQGQSSQADPDLAPVQGLTQESLPAQGFQTCSAL